MVKIGLTPASLTTLIDEANTDNEYIHTAQYNVERSIQNSTYIQGTGSKKIITTKTWAGLTRTEYDSIIQYCIPNSYTFWYVEITNTLSNILFSGYVYLEIDDSTVSIDDLRYDIKVKFIQV